MSEEQLKELEGLTVEEAKKKIEGSRMQFQILSRDGYSFPGTGDFRRNRVGIHVTRGKVTSAVIG